MFSEVFHTWFQRQRRSSDGGELVLCFNAQAMCHLNAESLWLPFSLFFPSVFHFAVFVPVWVELWVTLLHTVSYRFQWYSHKWPISLGVDTCLKWVQSADQKLCLYLYEHLDKCSCTQVVTLQGSLRCWKEYLNFQQLETSGRTNHPVTSENNTLFRTLHEDCNSKVVSFQHFCRIISVPAGCSD